MPIGLESHSPSPEPHPSRKHYATMKLVTFVTSFLPQSLNLSSRKPMTSSARPRATTLPPRSRSHTATTVTSASTSTPNTTTDEHWKSFTVPDNCLRLSLTLPSGQAFRWRRTSPKLTHLQSATGHAEQWVGAIGRHAFILRQAVPPPSSPNVSDPVWFQYVTSTATSSPDSVRDGEAERVLRDYFRADTDMSPIYKAFCEADPVFESIFPYFRGLRTLRQPPEECFFAFICSSNNHIKRISSMVTSLADKYGEKIASFKIETDDLNINKKHRGKKLGNGNEQVGDHEIQKDESIFVVSSFPSAEVLAEKADEKELRLAGFGYRAKFIGSSAKGLVAHAERPEQPSLAGTGTGTGTGTVNPATSKNSEDEIQQTKEKRSVEDMLLSWRDVDRVAVAKKLTRYPGVGRKVAGCIALMSLDKFGDIPVDTHVWKIAQRYRPQLAETKSLTLKVYEDVGEWFRERFGAEYAGIAHNFLFVGELPEFKRSLPEGLNPWGRQGNKKTTGNGGKGDEDNKTKKPKGKAKASTAKKNIKLKTKVSNAKKARGVSKVRRTQGSP